MNIRPLDPSDRGYCLFSWREGHKKAPGVSRMPWSYYKDTFGYAFQKIIDDPATKLLGAYSSDDKLLGAYSSDDKLLGWLAMTPGKRVSAVHWIHVKYELDGEKIRRRGVMTALLDAAALGKNFVYTLRARRDRAELPDGTTSKSLDESLVTALRAKGVTATFVPLKEYLK